MNTLKHLYEYNYDMPESPGIYQIINNVNFKSYIGQSMYLPRRAILLDHEHNELLQKAYKKYGIENFSISLLEVCTPDKLDEREIYWISELHTWVGDSDCRGYNLTPGGRGFRGVSDEERMARSLRMIGNTINLGRKPSEETRAKLRASAPKTHSKEHNLKVSQALKSLGIRPPGEDPESHRTRMLGNNYLTGKRFIHKGTEKKAVNESELDIYLSKGWLLGRGKNRKKV